MMTLEDLRTRVMAEFNSAGLQRYLNLQESQFREMPTFFEAAHFYMELTVSDGDVLPLATNIALRVKGELLKAGVELDYTVKATQRACA